MPWEVFPLPGQRGSEVEAFCPGPGCRPHWLWSGPGTAVTSSSCETAELNQRAGLNWLAMLLCSVGHSLKNKSDIKGSVFLPLFLNAIGSFDIQKSLADPWQIGASFFFLFGLAFSLLSPWISQIPYTLSSVLKFLTPSLPSVNTPSLLFTFNSRFFGRRSNFCSVLQFPSHFHPHSSLGNVDLFLTSSSRSKASGDHQQSSAKKCVGIA